MTQSNDPVLVIDLVSQRGTDPPQHHCSHPPQEDLDGVDASIAEHKFAKKCLLWLESRDDLDLPTRGDSLETRQCKFRALLARAIKNTRDYAQDTSGVNDLTIWHPRLRLWEYIDGGTVKLVDKSGGTVARRYFLNLRYEGGYGTTCGQDVQFMFGRDAKAQYEEFNSGAKIEGTRRIALQLRSGWGDVESVTISRSSLMEESASFKGNGVWEVDDADGPNAFEQNPGVQKTSDGDLFVEYGVTITYFGDHPMIDKPQVYIQEPDFPELRHSYERPTADFGEDYEARLFFWKLNEMNGDSKSLDQVAVSLFMRSIERARAAGFNEYRLQDTDLRRQLVNKELVKVASKVLSLIRSSFPDGENGVHIENLRKAFQRFALGQFALGQLAQSQPSGQLNETDARNGDAEPNGPFMFAFAEMAIDLIQLNESKLNVPVDPDWYALQRVFCFASELFAEAYRRDDERTLCSLHRPEIGPRPQCGDWVMERWEYWRTVEPGEGKSLAKEFGNLIHEATATEWSA